MGGDEIRKVLIVDDDAVLLRVLQRAFERELRVAPFTATSHAEALTIANAHEPELAIIDLQLGRESGLDVLRDIRARHPTIKLVVISGYGSIELAVRAIKAGADEFVQKPVTAREILARLHPCTYRSPIETPSADRALWEHVHRVLGDCGGNKSEAARRLRRPRSWLRRFVGRAAPSS